MYQINKILLKNGIREMISENEESFKNNITQVLAIKLNDSMTIVREEISKNILQTESYTQESKNIKNFIDFVESFKGGKFVCKDGSNINITENDVEKLKNLFESLNSENREKMTQELFNDSSSFKQHVEFAKNTKELI